MEDAAKVPGMVPTITAFDNESTVSGSVAVEGLPELSHLDRSLDVLRAKALEPYCTLDSLRSILEESHTVLIKGSWLLQCRGSTGVLPHRQDVPKQAICSPESILKCPVVAVSHCWLTPEHPDPKGKQLNVLAGLVGQFRRTSSDADFSVFFDWCSLYQESRVPEEQKLFEQSLRHVGIWFAHRETYVWLLSRTPDFVRPFEDRGWTTFERALSKMITPLDKVLDISKVDRSCIDWQRTVEICKLNGSTPPLPEALVNVLRLKFFSKLSDQPLVEKIYRRTFEDVMGSIPSLSLASACVDDDEASRLAQTLPRLERLECLDLRKNRLSDRGAKQLAIVFTSCLRLKFIALSENKISDKGAVELATALPSCRRLEQLDLARNLIGDHGAEKLAGAIPQCALLMELDLSDNEIGEAGAVRLAFALPFCKRLSLLGLFENQISNEGAEHLAAALPQCRVLQELNLGRNEIGDTGARKLAEAIPNCSSLQTLQLGGNEIGDSGAKELAAAIPRCGSLQKLDLAHNQIGDMGADRLAEAIPHCHALQELGLGGNVIGEILGGDRITDGGAEKVATAIQQCGHLQKLDLSENRIGNGGAAKLAAAMPQCNSLKELNLCGNQISDGGAEQLMVAIPQCKRLRTLSLWGNKIGNCSQSQLRKAWCASGKHEQELSLQI
jgi:Ran GTPase-activating protein (RanGAP) involved in mRNA processing and transport